MDYDKYPIAPEYNRGRQLPEQTMQQWLHAISDSIPTEDISRIIDLGCGTGRFSSALATHYQASVVGVDPSRTMLAQTPKSDPIQGVQFLQGQAEAIPCSTKTIDLVFVSMVYHHIQDRSKALAECWRVLKPQTYLCIRNSVTDYVEQTTYLRYFPTAKQINEQRLLSKTTLIAEILHAGFTLMTDAVISQVFARTLAEYAAKIGQRTLSDLNLISDQEFTTGMQALKYDAQHGDKQPVYEPIGLFVFQKV
jgi:ubiquinone/menaquinone biosynthesis C-methylase UbiE